MSNPTSGEKLEFPATNTPIAIFFAVVPTLTVVAIVAAIFKNKLPLFLIAPLLVLAVSCVIVAKEAVTHLGDTNLEITPQELVVTRLIGSASYPWNTIESIKLIDPGATFSDASRTDENRQAIGLFLKMPDRKEAPPNDRPDVLVVTRAGEDGDKVMKAFDKISIAKRNAGGKSGGKINGPANGRKSFRKTAAAA